MDREIAQNLGMIMKKRALISWQAARFLTSPRWSGLCVNYIKRISGKRSWEACFAPLAVAQHRRSVREGITLEMERASSSWMIISNQHEKYTLSATSLQSPAGHVASAQGIAAVEMKAEKSLPSMSHPFRCIYTTPEMPPSASPLMKPKQADVT